MATLLLYPVETMYVDDAVAVGDTELYLCADDVKDSYDDDTTYIGMTAADFRAFILRPAPCPMRVAEISQALMRSRFKSGAASGAIGQNIIRINAQSAIQGVESPGADTWFNMEHSVTVCPTSGNPLQPSLFRNQTTYDTGAMLQVNSNNNAVYMRTTATHYELTVAYFTEGEQQLLNQWVPPLLPHVGPNSYFEEVKNIWNRLRERPGLIEWKRSIKPALFRRPRFCFLGV